jgi:LysR family transcriptional regulator, chromosome initiation inhibitor
MMNLDPDQLEALAAAVSEGTFDAAARALHVTPSAVSQRVKALETSVGQVLVTRSKPVRATTPGETLLRAARQIQAVSADALRDLGAENAGAGPSVVALAVNADSLDTWFLAALAGLAGLDGLDGLTGLDGLDGLDGAVFDLRREDENRTAELLRRGEVMAAVTTSSHPVPGCAVRRLGAMRYAPRASAAFRARWFPDGLTVAALARAPVVLLDRDDTIQHRYLRRRARTPLHPPCHYVPESGPFFQAVRLGFGWGMIPDLQLAQDPGADLVDLDPAGAMDVELYWQQWRVAGPTLERVSQAVQATAAQFLR